MILVGLLAGLGIGWAVFRSSMDMQAMPASPPAAATEGGERKIAYYQDPMHPWYTSDKPGKAPDCGMDLVPVYADDANVQGIKIDPVIVQNIGVTTETVQRRPLTRTIRTTGRIAYDERRVYTVTTRVMGWVEKLHVDYTGRPVRKGEPLLDLYSPELVSTQEEYLQALKYRDHFHASLVEDAREGAVDLLNNARRRLLYWDIPEQEIEALEARGTPARTMPIPAPVSGVVLEKMVVAGQKIMAGMDLYNIADLSTVWVIADIYQYELPWVKVGQKVEVELSFLPGRTVNGTVTYIYPYLNAETNTAKIRVEVPNTPALDLKLDMLVTVRIVSPLSVEAVAVPEQAVIRSGERNVVVVALGNGYFDPREVTLGMAGEGYVQVMEGLTGGENIVTSSQFLIDSESNLKAAIRSIGGHEGHGGGLLPAPDSKTEENRTPATPPAAPEEMDHSGHDGHTH
jgi:multidrug efflux pump subunit AcrA (membrane-fusion protein)